VASRKKICLLGGSGFLGSRLASRLTTRGDDFVIPTRRIARRRHLLVLPNARVVEADINDPERLRSVVAGCSVVVNLVGILNERGRSGAGFRAAHTQLASRLVSACSANGVAKVIQVSALRASVDAPSHYLQTKGEAERIIAAAGTFSWTILQPSVMFGPGDSFTNRFARLLRWAPGVLPLAMPGARFAPIHVDDVVSAILRVIDDPATDNGTYQLCGPDVLTLRELVVCIARAAGLRRGVWGLPVWLSRMQARVMDFVPGKPFSTDNFLSLTVDSVCTDNGTAALGIAPRSFEAGLPGALEDLIRSRSGTRLRSAG
jgi:NADH dehydrogenase